MTQDSVRRALTAHTALHRSACGAVPQMTAHFRALGYVARLNEPWSGREGFMFSADWHAREHGAQALMLEVRQDLLVQPEWRARFLPQLLEALALAGYV